MSEIIPFPKLKQKLCSDIKNAIHQQQYEVAYDRFMDYEQHFEMSEELALMKCHVLWELKSYLELREEAHILLEQGYEPQDELMIFYVRSLYALGQYQSVVTVIEEILDNVNAHQTRMVLLPIKDQAQKMLDDRRKEMHIQLQQFTELLAGQQTELMLNMMDDSAYYFVDTIVYLLTDKQLKTSVQTLMLEYLRFARYNQNVQLELYGQKVDVVPEQLTGFESSHFAEVIMPEVIAKLEETYPSLVQEAHHHLNAHNIAVYPIDITQLADDQTWMDSYFAYFEEMMGLASTTSKQDSIIEFIKLLNT
ncbi:hypothetical protein MUA26_04990 [Staphylococcus sp. IVB6246]|uniref:hypothetical protein n=1 Tax=Staphylococcus sp. IVB6246 TaxID=2989772 RepID=UPI0021CF781F|nr:hypothetical protein [Staphylococcus sp. IVB6246]UXR70485.1 hypothetical protein MUA26_04990 [Staphylococcus sp. IVB6246]